MLLGLVKYGFTSASIQTKVFQVIEHEWLHHNFRA